MDSTLNGVNRLRRAMNEGNSSQIERFDDICGKWIQVEPEKQRLK